MEIQDKIEIYSAIPYAGSDGKSKDSWFHVAYNQKGEHIEAIWNIEDLFNPDIPETEKPVRLLGKENYFSAIRLHYALNYIAWRYHEDLLIWCMKALVPKGKLQVISPDLDWILKYWLAEAVDVDIDSYRVNRELEDRIEQLQDEIERLSGSRFSNFIKRIPVINRIARDRALPELQRVDHSTISKTVPDFVMKDVRTDWDFDLWLLQELYSSGAGKPQDSFKAVFGKRYLSQLLRRAGFIVNKLENNPQNEKQIEAYAFKHASRIIGG